ncbi:DUF3152 domain-containing protein [Streptomyces clavuligerus]|uniref:DUF3152 domain-containing protein n=1 Tax=Streptomyces clavuligerus TaxID=1901 RepID=B5GQ64_STRCL|nr:DUF3152 domain-containing protein [Streptomyces clavuligerus]ANW18276.1 hypothetical protein BB341_08585 [Streptomyces clavuligerus]AXU12839.1 DUF3152 domain-containing protein [Streptomyces clavuligerus]EDY48460.1 conserved hypothetical protein [Streptomyces clavuligerus]EFG09107.1 Hypothetical protein SCLAV_4033 [Streptomyces clavuligerus]MBY6302754.1 DUF3152 domain-containing protein [Streptomyces clavuligerus]
MDQGPPRTRGGHPEQRESGGAWGAPAPSGPYPSAQAPSQGAAHPAPEAAARPYPAEHREPAREPALHGAAEHARDSRIPGPRREFVEAFDAPGAPAPYAGPGTGGGGADDGGTEDGSAPPSTGRRLPGQRSGSKGRTLTGLAAAAVTAVLAVVVSGQVAQDRERDRDAGPAATGEDRADGDTGGADGSLPESRRDPSPAGDAVQPPTYDELMARQYPIDRELAADGAFEAVPGGDAVPGARGKAVRYRVDIEKGLPLDGALFARAVHRTLNDGRSWGGRGEMTFQRISSGQPSFVITLASPRTTDVWCAKSGLDTSIDKVSCDSAATDRVMINAYRWARGSETYGPRAMHAYRQMLINHEVGHRLGHGHVNCGTEGALAPVMQQQTKSLEINDIECRPNPWPYPGS